MKPRGTIDIMHERFLKEALKRANGSHQIAANLLGVNVRSIGNMMDKYKIPKSNKKKDN